MSKIGDNVSRRKNDVEPSTIERKGGGAYYFRVGYLLGYPLDYPEGFKLSKENVKETVFLIELGSKTVELSIHDFQYYCALLHNAELDNDIKEQKEIQTCIEKGVYSRPETFSKILCCQF